MFQDNPLLAQLKAQIQETLPKKEGIVKKATDKNYGFLEVDSKTSYFIPPPHMKKCLHGDTVSALIREDNGKQSAEPVALIEQSITRFIGQVKLFKGRLNIVPDMPGLNQLSLKAKTARGLQASLFNDGDWVVAELISHPLRDEKGFLVEITEKIADANDKIAPWWVTLAQNDLPKSEPEEPTGHEWQQQDEGLTRIDLTQIHFVTIDGESTKDMDDALYAKMLDSGQYELTVAIADPTAYVTADSELDATARERGFTIYLPGRNIPMLPRSLADNLCSLIENESRLALCCRMLIEPDGSINENVEFFATNIQSHARLNYEQVSDWLESPDNSSWQPSSDTAQVLQHLDTVAKLRATWRETHAVIFPNRVDYHFELSENNDVIAIHSKTSRTANKLVEETMVAANICAGRLLASKLNSGVFNTHSGIKSDKLAQVAELITESGLEITAEQLASVEGFSQVRRWLNQQSNAYLDNRLRKYQAYSEISTTPNPHFAMGLEIYATWTSPIRKYGDMVNHRLIKAIIADKQPAHRPDENMGVELAQHRKHHKIAERTISDWLYVRTLCDDADNKAQYKVEVFDISKAGIRARIIENGATVFVPMSSILSDRDRIQGNNEQGTVSIDNEVIYRLGDTLEVIITSVNQKTRSIVAKPKEVFADTQDNDSDTK